MFVIYHFLTQSTAFLKTFFFPLSAIEWNKLDIKIRNSRSFFFLRNTSGNSYHHPLILLYNSHNSKGVKLTVRLRLGFSDLSEH